MEADFSWAGAANPPQIVLAPQPVLARLCPADDEPLGGQTEQRGHAGARQDGNEERGDEQPAADDHLPRLRPVLRRPSAQAVDDEHEEVPREQALDWPGHHERQGLREQRGGRGWAAGPAGLLGPPAAGQGEQAAGRALDVGGHLDDVDAVYQACHLRIVQV